MILAVVVDFRYHSWKHDRCKKIQSNIISERNTKYLLIHSKIHCKSWQLSGVFKNMKVFAIPVTNKGFDMKINWNVFGWVNWYHH